MDQLKLKVVFMKRYYFIIRNLIIFSALILLHCIPWFIRNDTVSKPFFYGLATIQSLFFIWFGRESYLFIRKVWNENKLQVFIPLIIWLILLFSTPFLTQTMAVYSNNLFFDIHYPNFQKAAQYFAKVDPLENPQEKELPKAYGYLSNKGKVYLYNVKQGLNIEFYSISRDDYIEYSSTNTPSEIWMTDYQIIPKERNWFRVIRKNTRLGFAF